MMKYVEASNLFKGNSISAVIQNLEELRDEHGEGNFIMSAHIVQGGFGDSPEPNLTFYPEGYREANGLK